MAYKSEASNPTMLVPAWRPITCSPCGHRLPISAGNPLPVTYSSQNILMNKDHYSWIARSRYGSEMVRALPLLEPLCFVTSGCDLGLPICG